MNTRYRRPSLLATALFAAGLPMFHSAFAAPVGRFVGPTDPESVEINNGETVTGDRIGLESGRSSIIVTNMGTIRGNGNLDPLNAPSEGGINVWGGPAMISNTGSITGAGVGITTNYWYNAATGQLEGRARNSEVVNSGNIAGESNDGVRLIGGGTVSNNAGGTIFGMGAPGADGISMYPFTDQLSADYHAVVNNAQGGIVAGNRFGVIFSAGGSIENAGTINGNTGGVYIQGTALNSEERPGLAATVNNTGNITGANGYGVGFGSDLVTATLTNSGQLFGATYGISHGSRAALTVTNQAGGLITGGLSGLISNATGSLVLLNAGTIRGNGTYDGFDAPPDAGVVLQAANNTLTNSGSISGAGAGITTAYLWDDEAQELLSLAVGTRLTNTGTIWGESNDGVRLIGGGLVTNSGSIMGSGSAGADGVSMYAYSDQLQADYFARVDNQADGVIKGARQGIILSGGGEVTNAGEIEGYDGGIFIQGTALNSEYRGGTDGKVTNSGSIVATRSDGINGYGVGFGSDLASATLDNSGLIRGVGTAVFHGTSGDTTVTNSATGRLEGETGISASGSGALTLNNAGRIVSTGMFTGNAQAPADAGISASGSALNIQNSGTISAQQSAIQTQLHFDSATNTLIPLAIHNVIENSGTITGQFNDAIRLFGGGTITNSGTIEGFAGGQTDGITAQAFAGQDTSGSSMLSHLTNTDTGVIRGVRYGALLVSGASVENAGLIQGGTRGLVIGRQSSPNKAGSLQNSGSIIGGVDADVDTFSGSNSGIIRTNNGNGFYSSGTLEFTNAKGGEIAGSLSGVYSTGASGFHFTNAGTIRGNGGYDGFDAPPDAGITTTSADSVIVNSGTISGLNTGITTAYFWDAANSALIFRAVNTQVTNSGSIWGDNNDGVRLIGGGTLTNSGDITGYGGGGADGVSMYAFDGQPKEGYVAKVNNLTGGTLDGMRYGVAMSGGGSVDNAGEIGGGVGGVYIQGTALNGQDRSGASASVSNTGTITGHRTVGISYGVGFGSDLASASLTNSGDISSAHYGVYQGSRAALDLTNSEGGHIEGGKSGVVADSSGTLQLDNAGVIRGNGTYDGFDALPDAGVVLSTADSSITNSGTISGAGAGITTAYLYDEDTQSLNGLAVGTSVTNSGSIIGDSNDGVRLIGGGTVSNSGTISGKVGAGADGISMYAFSMQPQAGYSASVSNTAAGAIDGARFGIIMSGGGMVENAGAITGVSGGVFIQGSASGTEYRGGTQATVINSGTISGTKTTVGNGYAVGFGSDLAGASLTNSGHLSSVVSAGAFLGTSGAVMLNNAGGVIEGIYGVLAQGSGKLTLTNTGTIRSNGVNIGTDSAASAGITLQSGNAVITNSGTISGTRLGIVTQSYYNAQTQQFENRAVNTTVNNTGLIQGQTDDGIRLWGGGTVTNSGRIEGLSGDSTDGLTIQAFAGQDTSGSTMLGHVTNAAGGVIKGARYGALVVSGGEVNNAGTIEGGLSGVVIGRQSTAGKEARLTNSGSIIGGVELDVDVATATNTGSIVNAKGAALSSLGQVQFTNAGVLSGANGTAAVLSAFDDTVVLKTGSVVTGAIRAGDGMDSVTLTGTGTTKSATQMLSGLADFESLTLNSGYWAAAGVVGAFDTVDILKDGVLQFGTVLTPAGTAFTAIQSDRWTNAGRMVLDFAHNIEIDQDNGPVITGEGSIELIGEGVVTLSSDEVAHTGGTTVANGGLILTGTLAGNVETSGDGFFQLGVGGTEGTFAGDLLNNGMFVFKRSDDYDFNGAFSGTGVLEKYGAGTLSFMGDYDFTGTTTVRDGSVRIGGVIDPTTEFDVDAGTLDLSAQNQTIAGLSGGTTSQVAIGSTTLAVNQSGNTVFSGAITGTGNLIKEGDGKLNLTGTNTFTGTTTVNGGTLAVNGSVTSPVAVNSGGTLGGNGTVGTTTAGSGGVIAPGNSIGRLTVNGALNFAAGSIYQVETNAAGQADRIDATGVVTVAPTASVQVLAATGTYNPRTDYTILTGAGGVSGTFGTVSSDLAFLTPYLRYTTNAVTLSLYRNDINFASVATGANQVSIAKAVQARGINDPLYESLLAQNTNGAQALFTELSGELLASSVTALTDGSADIRDALLGVTLPADVGGFVWGSALGGSATFDAKDGMRSVDMDQNGMLVGAGMRGQWLSGAIGIGGGSADITIPGSGDRADVRSRHLVAELVHGGDRGLKITVGGASSKHDMDTLRMVAVGGVQTLTGTRDVTTSQYFAEVGYGFAGKVLRVTPFVRAAKIASKADAMVETGGVAALRVGAIDQDVSQTSVGARLQFDNTLSGVRPYLSAAWTRTSGDLVPTAAGNFASGGTGFTVSGMAIPKTSTEVQAGISLQTKGWQWNAGYNGRLSSHRDVHSFALNVSYKF